MSHNEQKKKYFSVATIFYLSLSIPFKKFDFYVPVLHRLLIN